MRVAIISVDEEILSGQKENTNASYLSRELEIMGILVCCHTVVGNSPVKLIEMICAVEKHYDLLIFTGGLDLTKETVATYLGRRFVEEYSETKKSQNKMPENLKNQTLIIEKGHVFENQNGLSSGMFLKQRDKGYLLLPSSLEELQLMFENNGKKEVALFLGIEENYVSKIFHLFGISEAICTSLLADLLVTSEERVIKICTRPYDLTLSIRAKGHTKKEAQAIIEDTERIIRRTVGQYIYGEDTENSLPQIVVAQLKAHRDSITAAESLTGGSFQEALASVSGVSKVFPGGFVTYSAQAKQSLLNISPQLLKEQGMVSEACAKAMAENSRMKMKTTIGVSFTGVAGPDTLEGHAVGTVWIGLAIKGQLATAHKYHFTGERNEIREKSVLTAFDLLRQYLMKNQ